MGTCQDKQTYTISSDPLAWLSAVLARDLLFFWSLVFWFFFRFSVTLPIAFVYVLPLGQVRLNLWEERYS